MSSRTFGCQLPGALHAGLKAAKKSENPGPKRQQALLDRSVFWKQIQREKKLEALMHKYDVTKTGNLTKEELGDLLQDAAKGRRPTEEVSPALELNFVLWTTHPKTGDDANRGDRITKNEIATALDVWRTWEQTLPEVMASSSSCCSSASSSSVGSDSDADLSTLCVQVEPLMAKYDVNHSGKLEFEQLKDSITCEDRALHGVACKHPSDTHTDAVWLCAQNMLTDLNEGRALPDEEVEWVMKAADGMVQGVAPS
eukprot:3877288-Rhodomonas_salina.1